MTLRNSRSLVALVAAISLMLMISGCAGLTGSTTGPDGVPMNAGEEARAVTDWRGESVYVLLPRGKAGPEAIETSEDGERVASSPNVRYRREGSAKRKSADYWQLVGAKHGVATLFERDFTSVVAFGLGDGRVRVQVQGERHRYRQRALYERQFTMVSMLDGSGDIIVWMTHEGGEEIVGYHGSSRFRQASFVLSAREWERVRFVGVSDYKADVMGEKGIRPGRVPLTKVDRQRELREVCHKVPKQFEFAYDYQTTWWEFHELEREGLPNLQLRQEPRMRTRSRTPHMDRAIEDLERRRRR